MKFSAVTSALLLLGLAGGAQAADTLAKIAAANKITLAYRESSVPFSYLDGPEKPIGFSVDIANAVVAEVRKKLNKPNIEVGLMAVTSQNRIPLISNGTIDLECGSTTNNTARAKDVAFAVNHFYTGTRLLVKKTAGVKDYADLKGKKVAITAGTTNMLVVRKYNEEKKLDIDIVSAKDHADALLLVESDRATAFAMDDILLFGLKSNAKAPNELEVVGESLQVEPYACMLPKDDPQFKALVDGVITGMMKSGEFEKLYNKWFMGPIPPKNQAIGLPLSPQLRDNIKTPSDKPAT
ncbi:transporter substrate-binding domain-containing protein [Variovorax sp. J22G21]|uniref:transporter substrate-binding domain-containing protein n=1 Tax=Variovorax fucosicus TaxID=3053517 RepID=UPI002575FBA4|nr:MULTISPECIES: transporter substrate-binding domain-containing protein [unclassified Variovorax]MDM0039231.1 transporter substrate-binding domain-containing protein [Variovorax sp. J22R193]MDM0055165.1 transporter substrate-binding domain-containing protein [Variovorax sp. J22G47]MDM0064007.1 transporter substrate-binding domain-containing protein [Variovorax sp. J22G21]